MAVRNEQGFRLQCYQKYSNAYEVMNGNDLKYTLEIGIQSLERKKVGRQPKYAFNQQGLELFLEQSIEYFKHINNVNADCDIDEKPHIIPDVESLCMYLGVTRKTLLDYENKRNEEWQNAVQFVKNMITSAKKQLALKNQMPPVFAIFDLCNNSGYSNTSEFKLDSRLNYNANEHEIMNGEDLRKMIAKTNNESVTDNDIY